MENRAGLMIADTTHIRSMNVTAQNTEPCIIFAILNVPSTAHAIRFAISLIIVVAIMDVEGLAPSASELQAPRDNYFHHYAQSGQRGYRAPALTVTG